MKKNIFKLIALVFAMAMAISVFAGCLMPSGMTPKVTNDEQDVKVAYSERKLVFINNASAAQVNVDTPLGFFCYQDNQMRILTQNSKTDEHDDSISYTLVVYDGEKNADGSNKANEADYSHSIKENGYLYLNSKVLGDVEITAKCANGSGTEVMNYQVVPHSISLFDIIIGAMGVYLLFTAIVGNGKLFQNDFVKEGMEEQHKRIVRVTSIVIGILMIETTAIALFDKYGNFRIATLAIFGIVIAVFLASTVLLRRCTDQEAKRKAMNDRYAAGSHKTPASAFIFDENEPTVEDIKK